MKNALLVALAALGSASAFATTLSAGDMAVLGYNTDNNDLIVAATLVDLQAGTQFGFCDYGVHSDGVFRYGGEGWASATLNQDYAAGTVFMFTSDGTTVTSNLNVTMDWDGAPAAPDMSLSTSGEQIFLYQGTIVDPGSDNHDPNAFTGNLLFGVNGDNTDSTADGWQADATSSSTSAKPAALGQYAMGLFPNGATELDNMRYAGITSGTKAELQAAILDLNNWTGSDSRISETAFVSSLDVQSVPEPTSMVILGLAGAAALARRKRK